MKSEPYKFFLANLSDKLLGMVIQKYNNNKTAQILSDIKEVRIQHDNKMTQVLSHIKPHERTEEKKTLN